MSPIAAGYVIRIVEATGGILEKFDPRFAPPGSYVIDCDVDAWGGLGEVTACSHPEHAKRFETKEAAFAYWKRQSTATPLRVDGKPNRPLTVFTVEIEAVTW